MLNLLKIIQTFNSLHFNLTFLSKLHEHMSVSVKCSLSGRVFLSSWGYELIRLPFFMSHQNNSIILTHGFTWGRWALYKVKIV